MRHLNVSGPRYYETSKCFWPPCLAVILDEEAKISCSLTAISAVWSLGFACRPYVKKGVLFTVQNGSGINYETGGV